MFIFIILVKFKDCRNLLMFFIVRFFIGILMKVLLMFICCKSIFICRYWIVRLVIISDYFEVI